MDAQKITSDKLLIFGGVYSNLQALQSLIKQAEKLNIPAENCICTGDIVGYCASPEETIQTFKNWGAKSILGNVEIQLINEALHCGCDFSKGSKCDVLSNIWYPYAQKNISKDSLDFLKTLPEHLHFTWNHLKISTVHGSHANTSEFVFNSTPWHNKQQSFNTTQSDVIIAGHSGLPFYDYQENKYWINPGVIGMPANDGTPKVWYAILEQKEQEITISYHQLDYDFSRAAKLMLQHNLPNSYAQTLSSGIWDNMDILPTKESKLQGQKITLDSLILKSKTNPISIKK
ncbi:metallophosphoesterase family protein [Wenyingzhuangia aestuarii]|uniref:metallophosphoesterase family protein n=1 Tax=Wenyingzhuangia aestuarii TaxID=1647582 RepID=UPI001439BF10|nr:metallophosphoesterase family protein [Wenyingzhuangia aestuarii]NJB83088.1 putative phosphodiesterase [Wenyingzhuangia aestuarii]